MGKWEINQQLTPQSDIANNISSKDATGNQSQREKNNFIASKSWALLASKSVQKLIFSKTGKLAKVQKHRVRTKKQLLKNIFGYQALFLIDHTYGTKHTSVVAV